MSDVVCASCELDVEELGRELCPIDELGDEEETKLLEFVWPALNRMYLSKSSLSNFLAKITRFVPGSIDSGGMRSIRAPKSRVDFPFEPLGLPLPVGAFDWSLDDACE